MPDNLVILGLQVVLGCLALLVQPDHGVISGHPDLLDSQVPPVQLGHRESEVTLDREEILVHLVTQERQEIRVRLDCLEVRDQQEALAKLVLLDQVVQPVQPEQQVPRVQATISLREVMTVHRDPTASRVQSVPKGHLEFPVKPEQ